MNASDPYHDAKHALPELRELLFLAGHLPGSGRVETLATLDHQGTAFPLLALSFGPDDPTAPVLAVFGGVHGLERIGTRVVLSYLQTLMELARWDRSIQRMFETTRLLIVPLINPVGMMLNLRSNGNFVDLMRNSPVEADGISPWHLFGGHRLTPHLPWYRGVEGAPMETEAQAVCDFVRREIFPAKLAIGIDIHSGYGIVDRLWFPYARTHKPFAGVAEAMALKQLLDRTYARHVYRIEPQSREYLAHGDLWDYLYDEYRAAQPDGCFIPFTLELGSWLWVKKNWWQFFSRIGLFNPSLPHRERRILRRHLFLLDFLYRAVHSPEPWAFPDAAQRERRHKRGVELWYENK